MFCSNCGNQVPDNLNFCPNCGGKLYSTQQSTDNQNLSQPQINYQPPMDNAKVSKKGQKIMIIVIIILTVLLVGAVGFGVYYFGKYNNNEVHENIDNDLTQNNGNKISERDISLTYDENGDFLFPIEDVFSISGRGTVVTGRVERGEINLGDEVQIIGLDREIITTKVLGIEMFRKQLDSASIDDNAGLLLKNVSREDVERGQVLAKPGSINAKEKFQADIYILTEKEGGKGQQLRDGYKPQFYFRTTDITGSIKLPDGIYEVNPGETVNVTVELENDVAMEIGTEFSIREDGRTVGRGVVTAIH